MRFCVALLTALLFATPVLPSDGVLEINQACAVNTGCFSGDTAGLPVTISASGSYLLTSNLVVTDENTDGIRVSADDVGIDLNNFVILGPVVCSGTSLVCTPNSGSGSGVERTSTFLPGISVRNGSVRGMGRYGVLLGKQAEVTGLRVRSNRLDGITVHFGSIVSGNTAYQNGNVGISASGGSTVSGNTAYDNGDDGISVGTGSTVSGNTSYGNDGDGIFTGNGVTVQGNTVGSNGGYGLNLDLSTAGYRENVITSNATGTVNDGVNMGGNSCNGTTTCP